MIGIIYPNIFFFRYLATGNSFRSLAYSFRMGESTVREIVYTTCTAIWTVLKPIVMPVPNQELWIKSEKGFCDKWNFPNAVAAIDGKHVVIQAPPHSGSDFFCYKKHFSTVLLALVDPDYKFLFIDVGGYGKNSDASIFRTSYLGKSLADGSFNLPPPKALPGGNTILPHVIIGDEAFPLSTYLMRPYSRDNVQQDEEKKIFNYRLSRPRNTAENAFGILARKFRIFERRLNVSHEHCVSIVTATCCLHNFLRDDACHWTQSDLDLSMSNVEGLRNILGTGGASRQDALEVRDSFKEYFNSEIGSVEWQQRRVRIGQRLT